MKNVRKEDCAGNRNRRCPVPDGDAYKSTDVVLPFMWPGVHTCSSVNVY